MMKELPLLAAAVFLAAGCSTLPRPDKVQKPPYVTLTSDAEETMGEFFVLTPSFKVLLPDAEPQQQSYLETQVAEFSRVKLYKYGNYGAEMELASNDKKYFDEQMAQYGAVTRISPEKLTLSARYISGKKPRIEITAAPDILDAEGNLHFTLADYPPGSGAAAKRRARLTKAAEGGQGPEASTAAGQKAAEIRSYLLRKYGQAPKLKRSGTVFNQKGQPIVTIETELTFFPENARITYNGTVKNLSAARIWASYYLPQLTYQKGKDWFTFSANRFGASLTGAELKSYQIGPGDSKKFQFSTDPELKLLSYDPATRMITERNAFSSREEDDLLKYEIIEKYLSGAEGVVLEVFPDKLVCTGCGVKLY